MSQDNSERGAPVSNIIVSYKALICSWCIAQEQYIELENILPKQSGSLRIRVSDAYNIFIRAHITGDNATAEYSIHTPDNSIWDWMHMARPGQLHPTSNATWSYNYVYHDDGRGKKGWRFADKIIPKPAVKVVWNCYGGVINKLVKANIDLLIP